MKPYLPRTFNVLLIMLLMTTISCSRRHYASTLFEQQTAGHKLIAVLPAEMIFTGTQPKNLTQQDIARIEEQESKSFQVALYNSILRYANTRQYMTTVNVQDFVSTQRILEENNIPVRDAWHKDDAQLAKLLGVDAVVRMRIQQKRYMSDYASYGIDVAREITKLPIPYGINKTNDIYATCSLVSDGQTLWNNNYKGASNWNMQANEVVEQITDNFGRNFPYKQRR
jgi:hypothetical protein